MHNATQWAQSQPALQMVGNVAATQYQAAFVSGRKHADVSEALQHEQLEAAKRAWQIGDTILCRNVD
jgi:hypothetical protein